MKPTDAAALTIINKEQLGYEVPVDVTCKQIEKLLLASDREFLYVYEETKTGKILGYVPAQLYETIYSQTLLNVLGLAVAKEAEGRGIGKQLMTKLETEAKKCNLSAIRLNSGNSVQQPINFMNTLAMFLIKNKSDSLNTWILKLCL